MEHFLECISDPREFYCPDSPVLGDGFRSNQVSSGAEFQDDNQANSSFLPNVRYSYLSCGSSRLVISAIQQPQVVSPRDLHPQSQVVQHQNLHPQPQVVPHQNQQPLLTPPIGFCACQCASTLGTDHGQQSSNNNVASLTRQIGIHTQGQGSRVRGRRRGGSPQYRGDAQKSLAVSSRLV